MIKRIKSHIKRCLTKKSVLEIFTIDGVDYTISDTTSIIPSVKNQRTLLFKTDNRLYNHSSIYINPKYHFQPSYSAPQKITATWSEVYPLTHVLVLGCAGCTFPRFVGLHYPESKTIGVEISEDFIQIAKKYFLLDQIEKQFELVHGDAIEYVKKYNLTYKQDMVYVDLFCENKLIPEILTEDFVNGIGDITDENSVIIINIWGQNADEILSFFNGFQKQFQNIFIVKQGHTKSLVLTKTADPVKDREFIDKLKAAENFTFVK